MIYVLPSKKPRTRKHCRKGHLLAIDNLYKCRDGRRRCKICRLGWEKKYAQKKRFPVSVYAV